MAVVLVAAGLAVLGGCSSTPSSAPGGQSTTTGTTTSQPTTPSSPGSGQTGTGTATDTTPPAAATVTLRDADKGKTVMVKVGEQVTLTLAGTDWGFTDPKPPSVLTPMSPPIVAKEQGSSSISFRAAKPGTATVTANRAGGDTFQITVVVQ